MFRRFVSSASSLHKMFQLKRMKGQYIDHGHFPDCRFNHDIANDNFVTWVNSIEWKKYRNTRIAERDFSLLNMP